MIEDFPLYVEFLMTVQDKESAIMLVRNYALEEDFPFQPLLPVVVQYLVFPNVTENKWTCTGLSLPTLFYLGQCNT